MWTSDRKRKDDFGAYGPAVILKEAAEQGLKKGLSDAPRSCQGKLCLSGVMRTTAVTPFPHCRERKSCGSCKTFIHKRGSLGAMLGGGECSLSSYC